MRPSQWFYNYAHLSVYDTFCVRLVLKDEFTMYSITDGNIATKFETVFGQKYQYILCLRFVRSSDFDI